MAGARLEYDDSGTTFYYFLLAFYFLVLLPVTYFIYPRSKKKAGSYQELVCQCEPCISKRMRVEMDRPRRHLTTFLRYGVLAVLWGLLLLMVYKVAMIEKDYEEYDPFQILELAPGSTMVEIRKQYRKLSKVFHPDKQGGDQVMFMKIAKAYEALTDNLSRENLEKYGNPDGPQAASFGIALPAWIVEKQNSLWVLAAYVGVFMVGLPSVVGVWWYRSVKYGTTHVLLQTSQLFGYYLSGNKALPFKRIVLILTAAMEFNNRMSPLLPSRPSDDIELSRILASKSLPHIIVKPKEKFLGTPCAIKAQILLHSHIERVALHSNSLETDQKAVLKTCPYLLQEMINILIQLWAYYHSQKKPAPSLDSFEEVMKVSGMLVQGMWTMNSPLVQLPHLTAAHLRHFRTKKRNISSVEQFAGLQEPERRKLVRTLTDEEYLDVLAVCGMFPRVTIQAETQVVDDENTDMVTVGSLVTMSVTMQRSSLLEAGLLETSPHASLDSMQDGKEVDRSVDTLYPKGVLESKEERDGMHSSVAAFSKKSKKGAVSNRKKAKGQDKIRRRTANLKKAKKVSSTREESASEKEDEMDDRSKSVTKKQTKTRRGRKDQRGSGSSVDEDEDGEQDDGEKEMDEEEEWKKLQQSMQKLSKKKFEHHSTDSHTVHAPYFPEEKQEFWWLYVADKRSKEMICPPKRITGLMSEHTTDFHFNAPDKLGVLHYSVILRSDSYLDLCFIQDIKLTVGAHQEVKGRAQWADLEEEEEEEEVIEESLSESESLGEDYEDDSN